MDTVISKSHGSLVGPNHKDKKQRQAKLSPARLKFFRKGVLIIMLLNLPYGEGFLQIDIPEERLDMAVSRPLEPLRELREGINKSLLKPIGSKPLRRLLGRSERVCVIVPDETRPCPTRQILPHLLNELETSRPSELEILIGNGLHRGMSEQEMADFLGGDVVKGYNVTNHTAVDKRQLVDLEMKTSYGTPAIVNRLAAKSDHLIGIGLVEPHFFAGYSGGRKTVLPAVAGKVAIFNNHSYRMIGDPKACYGILDGNPIHHDMVEFMRFVHLSFIVNVTINRRRETTQIFAGDPIEAHERAVSFLNHYVNVKVRAYADVVIVSNGGYPSDRDLYQTVKGIVTAKGVVKEGGVIIMVAECRDGLGGHEEFRRLMQKAERPKDVLREIRTNEPVNDQWQAQLLATTLEKAEVIVVTDGVNHKVMREMMIEPASTLDEALELAGQRLETKKPKILAIPEGSHVIPHV